MKTPTRRARLEDLGQIAWWVFVVRNASRQPAKDRMQIKAKARPSLREAIHWVRESREALRAGDLEMQALLRDRAMMHLAFALTRFCVPLAEQMRKRYDALARISPKGGTATKRHLPELERQIRACLKRGEPTRRYAKAWADEHNVSADTVRRRIMDIKRQL